MYTFLNKKWFFDKIYNEFIGQFFFKWSYSVSYKEIDRGIFEMLGPQGFSDIVQKIAYQIHKLQSHSIYQYTLIIITMITLILSMNFFLFFINLDFRLTILLGSFIIFLLKIEKL